MPQPTAAIAVDAGGTTTRAVVITHDGSCGPVMRTGPGNPVRNPELAAANIAGACESATKGSPVSPQLVVAAVAGAISRDFPELPRELERRGLPVRITIVSDLVAAYFSATAEQNGCVLIVGTGTVAARIQSGRISAIRDGLGWLLGDDGSGFWIGQRVARAVAAELDGRGPATTLTPRVLELLHDIPERPGVRPSALAALLTWSQSRAPVDLSALAILAAEEETHDEISAAICSEAAAHALATLTSLPESDTLPVALGGGALQSTGPVGRRVHSALGKRAVPVADGVAGAALMAVRELGGTADARMLAHISSQLHDRND